MWRDNLNYQEAGCFYGSFILSYYDQGGNY